MFDMRHADSRCVCSVGHFAQALQATNPLLYLAICAQALGKSYTITITLLINASFKMKRNCLLTVSKTVAMAVLIDMRPASVAT